MSSSHTNPEGNIFSDKGSLVLEWLLIEGIQRESFSLREVSHAQGVSLGIVQKVFSALIKTGILSVSGVRTSKSFSLQKPEAIINSWLENYQITARCRMRTYRSALGSRNEILKALSSSAVKDKVAFALHSAAQVHKCKNSNLETVELYLLEPDIRLEVETFLELEPQEKGYEVLLIEPYYKSLLKSKKNTRGAAPLLLTYLDLYHFPLRGREQAEFIAHKIEQIRAIYDRQ